MKYELFDEKKVNGHILHRVRYEDGSLGGWIEGEKNLDPDSNARVYGNARIYDEACVYGDACVFGNAHVFGDARVYGCSYIFGYAHVSGDAHVCGDAHVYGDAHVSGDECVSGNSRIYTNAWVTSPLHIQGSLYFFYVSSKNNIKVGCKTKTMDEWLKTYKQEFIKNKFTETQQKEYKQYFNLASNLYEWGILLPL